MSNLHITNFDAASVGRPAGEHRHHRLREVAAIVSAIAGGLTILLAGLAVMASIPPSESTALWVAIIVLGAIWMTGLWWRWDAPDARMARAERERRGF